MPGDLITWSPYIAIFLGVVNALIAVIYSHHQKEFANLKAHIESVEADFAAFKRGEFKDLQTNVNIKLDQVIDQLHQLNLNLVQNYASKLDLREAVKDLRRAP